MRYPQQLRVLLGIAKLAGAIVLVLTRLPTLKEWAYAGFAFTWIAASVANQKELLILKDLIEAGKLTPVIDRSYQPGEVPEAIRYLEEGHAQGNVLITVH